eukprot:13955608-Alexandrium_andersonii.AAC.1
MDESPGDLYYCCSFDVQSPPVAPLTGDPRFGNPVRTYGYIGRSAAPCPSPPPVRTFAADPVSQGLHW